MIIMTVSIIRIIVMIMRAIRMTVIMTAKKEEKDNDDDD